MGSTQKPMHGDEVQAVRVLARQPLRTTGQFRSVSRRALRFGLSHFVATVLQIAPENILLGSLQIGGVLVNGVAFVASTAFASAANTAWSFNSLADGRRLLRYPTGSAGEAWPSPRVWLPWPRSPRSDFGFVL